MSKPDDKNVFFFGYNLVVGELVQIKRKYSSGKGESVVELIGVDDEERLVGWKIGWCLYGDFYPQDTHLVVYSKSEVEWVKPVIKITPNTFQHKGEFYLL